MEVIDPQTGIIIRQGTFDEWILRESRSYFPLGIQPTDRILDLGGHIGTFASRVMLECHVPLLSIEAERSNYGILFKNGERFNFETSHSAIVDDGNEGQLIDVYVNELKNNALHSTVPVRGRNKQVVSGRGFSKTVSSFNPTIIKCDIEGAEYDLPWESLVNCPPVRKVVMELHLTHKGHRQRSETLINLFPYMGFRCTKSPKIGEKNWTTMAVWER